MEDLLNKNLEELISLSTSRFPEPLGRWMGQFISAPLPDETRADCSLCPPMRELPMKNAVQFTSKARCCTYIPNVSNFQVGAVFSDGDPAAAKGREQVASRLASRRGVTPLGIFPDAEEKKTYREIDEQEDKGGGFGRTDDYICPYFVEGGAYGCGIWKYRSAACGTWFCRHVRGALAKDYWKKLYRLLDTAESEIRYRCLIEMNLPPRSLAALLPPFSRDLSQDFTNDEAYSQIWGPWLGREPEFYRACAEYVASLTWKDVERIAGPELTIRMRQLQDAQASLMRREMSSRLRPGRFSAEGFPGRPELTRVVSYLPTDVLHVPTAAMIALHLFNGRPLNEVLKDAARFGLSEETVRLLVDFKILTND